MSSQRPNIIFIYADDLGRGMLSCYGQQHFQTPNIDRIATEGMRFSRAYGCAFCAPARASLLMGKHDCHRGGWTYSRGGIYQRVHAGQMSLDEASELITTISHTPGPEDRFLPQLAKQAGYRTAQIGKLEWGFAATGVEIQRHGWDEHYGYYDHVDCHGFYPPYLFENGKMISIDGNTRLDHGKAPANNDAADAADKRWDRSGCAVYSQDLFDQRILEFLRRQRDEPFFLYHPSQLPHGPISIPEIHSAVAQNPALSDYEKEYASMVLRLDQTVGMVLDELERLGIADNTMVLFASDNGHMPYYLQAGRCSTAKDLNTGEAFDQIDHPFTSEAGGDVFDGNDSMSGLKFSNLEGGVRLPFVARWPGQCAAGRDSDRLIASYDLFATFAELFGLPVPENQDSVSFLSELRGDEGRDGRRGANVVCASGLGPTLINDDGWKIRQLTLPGVNRYQLFHLPSDPFEQHNRNHDEAERCHTMGAELLFACDGNFHNGMPEAHHVWYPGLNFHGPDCEWDMMPL
jgi:arylsulfatase A-like enzyme